jgi:hypothetical protein
MYVICVYYIMYVPEVYLVYVFQSVLKVDREQVQKDDGA